MKRSIQFWVLLTPPRNKCSLYNMVGIIHLIWLSGKGSSGGYWAIQWIEFLQHPVKEEEISSHLPA